VLKKKGRGDQCKKIATGDINDCMPHRRGGGKGARSSPKKESKGADFRKKGSGLSNLSKKGVGGLGHSGGGP